jgi:beta-lactamase superfamily II metal-dependent hydrolase
MSPAIKKTTKKPTAKKAAAKTAAKKGAASNPAKTAPGKVTVRMYNAGFGDAFLLIIPAKDRDRKVLIDCGVHASGRNPKLSISELVKKIVEDVTEDETPRIDVVIATHRHQDHVEGFREALWAKVEVGEVWMPWTENRKDPVATEIRDTQGKIASKLEETLKKKLLDPQKLGLSRAKIKEMKELLDFIWNSLPNAKPMDTLHEGFAGGVKVRRRFLPYKTRRKNSFETDLLPGVIIHAMGPSRDPEVIRDMNPPKGKSYLRLMESLLDAGEQYVPFRDEWVLDADEFNNANNMLTPNEIKKIRNVGDGSEFGVAVKLEDAVNGTSLMLMFQIGKAFLLFPGDAQWGTWESAKNDSEWFRLLEKTNFYKVGHHGSHNATPKEFVTDILKENFLAMVPVRPIKRFKRIPRTPLIDALRNKPGKVVRSDKPDLADPPEFKRVNDVFVELEIPI